MFTLQSVTESFCFKNCTHPQPCAAFSSISTSLQGFSHELVWKNSRKDLRNLIFLKDLSVLRVFLWLQLLLSPETLLSLQNNIPGLHQAAATGSHSHGYFQWYSKATKSKFQTVPQNITSQNMPILCSCFLFSSLAVDSTLAQHSLNLFHMCQQLYTCHVSEWGTGSESKHCPLSHSCCCYLASSQVCAKYCLQLLCSTQPASSLFSSFLFLLFSSLSFSPFKQLCFWSFPGENLKLERAS